MAKSQKCYSFLQRFALKRGARSGRKISRKRRKKGLMTFRKIYLFVATAMLAAFLSGPVTASENEGDPVKGEKVFKKCKACHQ
ncbi:MAG: hypothetical protein K8F25_00605, partial [Fimbriimonadaceae bacterium]|nr:hypothetical protein [Alphaproteobacteria bacterium]